MYKSYKEDCADLASKYPDLAARFVQWSFLDQVFNWTNQAGSDFGSIEFIQQDEFSHDAIFHYLQCDCYLVFGVT
jgi:hypothetical protein